MASKSSQTNDRVKEILEQLKEGIKDIFTSEKFTAYLKTMSKFYHYSVRNTLLIHSQMPRASKVAGFVSWKKEFKRYVKKGEKGIWILAPIVYKEKKEMEKIDPDTQTPLIDKNGNTIIEEAEVTIPRFKAISVFDVSQTDGKPLPSLAEDLTGDVRHYEVFFDALKAISPLPIFMEQMPEDNDGYCRMGENIAIREGMSEIQTVCAGIHEITHATLHDPKSAPGASGQAKSKNKMTKEIEAESVSYVVCQFFGIETGANSFGYVAEWSGSMSLAELKASLDTIRITAATLIERIDAKYKELLTERGLDSEIESPAPEAAEPAAAEPLTDNLISDSPHEAPAAAESAPTVPSEPLFAESTPQSTGEQSAVTVPHEPPAPESPPPPIAPADLSSPQEAASDTPAFDGLFPDPAIGLSERDLYGYTQPSLLPLLQKRALELFDSDHTVYAIYPDNTDSMIFEREEITAHDGIFGIEAADWIASAEYADMAKAQDNGEAPRESALLSGDKNVYGIYQLRQGAERNDYRTADRNNYKLVYTAPLTIRDTLTNLNQIYKTINENRPADFTGHSLSAGDVIVLQWQGKVFSHYLDNAGFQKLPDFTGHEQPVENQTVIPLKPRREEKSAPPSAPSQQKSKPPIKPGRSRDKPAVPSAAPKAKPPQAAQRQKPSILRQVEKDVAAIARGKTNQPAAPDRADHKEV